MNTGFLYFSHGTKHAVRITVSLFSLRKFWRGPVAIADTGDGGGIVEKIAGDSRLSAQIVRIPFIARRRHSCYVCKSTLWRHSPFAGATIFIDGDTLFVRDPAGLVEIVEDVANPPVFVTRFSDWVTCGNLISGRLRQWDGVRCEGINVKKLLKESLESPHAAVNTGVVAWRGRPGFLEDWERLSAAGERCSFTDELAAQLLVRKHRHTLLGDRFNFSVLYGRERDCAVTYHFHGNKALRPEAGGIWWDAYRECVAGNVAGICEWSPANDPALIEFLARQ